MTRARYNILHTEWSDGWGGQEQRIILECLKMRELGHQVVIACQPGSGILKKARELELPVEEVVMRGSIDPLAVLSLARVIRKHRINVVSTHSGKDSWSAGFAAKVCGVDLLVRTRHLSMPVSNNPFNFVYRMADGIVTTGEAIRNTMIADNGIDPGRIISIATGVSLDRFSAAGLQGVGGKEQLGIPARCRVVTMVAVLRGMKRHDLLVEAARLLRPSFPDLRFLVVGEGPGRGWVEGLIREAGVEDLFILTGYRSDVPELLSISDIAVLTSDKFEGVPQSISQAMAMGRPVVAAPVGSIPELVVDGVTGIMAETGNAASFASGIGALLRDDELRRKMGKAAQAHIMSGYTDDIMAQKTVEFYEYLLERKGKR
ncbi:glycosyltransferase [Geomonas sp. RF6]|uniref:glycosyltransferase n=1 Tax=Geomonas sp. RF6 TaxID=2897342 RepID=UPI001E4B197E|nr:glycosyltransferase [Geomonas sp. RF6]UFS68644.1 glycosyltransferase [Geomonas sp. RF6]